MSDITANLVVGMPAQIFTLARSFKANANGKIYLGIPDTDPTIPENQIQVYIESETGDLIPTAQPIVINAGGYPVYNGQISKFVTVKNYSMAVYDFYGVQQFYFPDIAKYDPDQLRQELASGNGSLVSIGNGKYLNDLFSYSSGNGDALIPVIQPYAGAVQRNQHEKNAEHLTVADWGAVSEVESSISAQKMIDDTGMLIVPEGFTLVAKNLNLTAATKIIINGKLKLPSGCVDFDRLLYAAGNNSGLIIHINEIDGNKAGQSGQIGTHLVYLTDCQKVDFYAHYVHDHYYPRTFTTAPSPDGIRNDGSGCLFFYQCHNSKFIVDRIESWGHEAFYIYKTNRSIAALGHAQGAVGDDSYSGIQFSGDYNRLLYASVDLASASSIGFDCRWSMAGKLISTNTQFFNGINFGHAGLPTSGSSIESVYVNSCGQHGVNFAAGSTNTKVLSAYINAAGHSGINQSDGAAGNTVNNATIVNSAVAQATSFQNNLILTNANLATVTSALIPKLNATGGGSFTTRNVRLSSTDSMEMKVFNGLGGVASATLTDGNINPYAHIVIYPANASAAAANAYIASQTTGSLVLATQSGTAAAGGASFRYMVI